MKVELAYRGEGTLDSEPQNPSNSRIVGGNLSNHQSDQAFPPTHLPQYNVSTLVKMTFRFLMKTGGCLDWLFPLFLTDATHGFFFPWVSWQDASPPPTQNLRWSPP